MVRTDRRRYLLFQTYSEGGRFRRGELYRAIQNSLTQLFGAYGLSQANLSLLEYDEEKGVGILRCSHRQIDAVKAALVYLQELEGKPATFRTIRTSGTLKSLKSHSENYYPKP